MITATSTEQRTPSSYAFLKSPFFLWGSHAKPSDPAIFTPSQAQLRTFKKVTDRFLSCYSRISPSFPPLKKREKTHGNRLDLNLSASHGGCRVEEGKGSFGAKGKEPPRLFLPLQPRLPHSSCRTCRDNLRPRRSGASSSPRPSSHVLRISSTVSLLNTHH